jgi:hypothetical protein
MKCVDIYGNILTNYGEGSVYVKGDGNNIVNRAEYETRNIYYKDVYIVGFSGFATVNRVLSSNGETTTVVHTNGYGASNTNELPLEINYTIYYNDGTILQNSGADITLLTNTGKESKTNKIKVKANKSEYPHKHVCATINGMFKIKNPNKRDLVKPEIPFKTDILQYGYSITTGIYNLTFKLKNMISEGYDELNNDIISDLIYDINYTLQRSEGEIENIIADNLSDANLKLISFEYIDDQYGMINSISENNSAIKKKIGLLQVHV